MTHHYNTGTYVRNTAMYSVASVQVCMHTHTVEDKWWVHHTKISGTGILYLLASSKSGQSVSEHVYPQWVVGGDIHVDPKVELAPSD